ncbi:MAG: tRNA-uridine aminocarboxypropyltransferase [Bdellovibrionota bacterium]
MENPCPRCGKRTELCVCTEIRELPTKTRVLILQHPQEPDKDLGTAKLASLALPNSQLKIGLSWPNLRAASGLADAQPAKWAVLYLGSGIQGKPLVASGLQFVTKKGAPVPPAGVPVIEGLVVIDGTWSQAKALWWRNAWLLKLKRAVLVPKHKSLYGELRREPRRECLSTIDSIGESLVSLGEPQGTADGLRELFGKLLEKERQRRKAPRR